MKKKSETIKVFLTVVHKTETQRETSVQFEDIIHRDANEGTTSKEADCKVQEKKCFKGKAAKPLSMNSHPLYVSYMQNKN